MYFYGFCHTPLLGIMGMGVIVLFSAGCTSYCKRVGELSPLRASIHVIAQGRGRSYVDAVLFRMENLLPPHTVPLQVRRKP